MIKCRFIRFVRYFVLVAICRTTTSALPLTYVASSLRTRCVIRRDYRFLIIMGIIWIIIIIMANRLCKCSCYTQHKQYHQAHREGQPVQDKATFFIHHHNSLPPKMAKTHICSALFILQTPLFSCQKKHLYANTQTLPTSRHIWARFAPPRVSRPFPLDVRRGK